MKNCKENGFMGENKFKRSIFLWSFKNITFFIVRKHKWRSRLTKFGFQNVMDKFCRKVSCILCCNLHFKWPFFKWKGLISLLLAVVSCWPSSSTCSRRECLKISGTGILWGFLLPNRQCQSTEGHFVQPNVYFEPLFSTRSVVRFCLWHCLCDVCFVRVWNISESVERICTKFTRKRVWSLARTSLNVKVKGQGHQGQKTAFFGPFGGLHAVYVW